MSDSTIIASFENESFSEHGEYKRILLSKKID